jgi:nucleotide-binding universal stress UspA family protein/hemerythrin-like domain-containing protein
MYRHIFVPIDGTELSIQVVGNAVALARAVGARVTFFHAVPDHAGSLRGDLDVLRLTSTEDYNYALTGKTRELLSKAEAAGRALGVPCESMWTTSNKPAQAIVESARARECDLIFMASHGGHGKLGMALASETLSVLLNAGIPVLVSATGDPKPPARAIAVIRDEHRSIAAALHAWTNLLADARSRGTYSNAADMRAIARYLSNFPLELHHPKEDKYLFRLLRERTHAVDAELDELERQHVRDHTMVAELNATVESLATARDDAARIAATRTLEQAVARYADFHWEHMGREEAVILPAAQKHLTADDWEVISAAFTHDADIGAEAEADHEYHHLIARIVSLPTSH